MGEHCVLFICPLVSKHLLEYLKNASIPPLFSTTRVPAFWSQSTLCARSAGLKFENWRALRFV